jgi:MFS family permease
MNEENINEENGKNESFRSVYARQALRSFADGVGGPYIPIYAVELGASSTEVGWLRSLGNLFGNIMQIPWGIVSDRYKRYVLFIIIGSLLNSLFWLPLVFANTPWELIVILTAQAFTNSLIIPSWSALLGEMAPKKTRGSLSAKINIIASLGSMTATLISGYIMTYTKGNVSNVYTIPFLLASASGLISSIVMFKLKRKTTHEKKGFSIRAWTDPKIFKGDFRRFCLLTIFHGFFMSISWPLFPLTIVRIVEGDMMKVAYRSIISGTISIIIRRFIGRISDRAGRKTILVAGRAGIFLYPLIYSFATSIYHLYAAEIVVGILAAGSEIAIFAYMLDITPNEQRGSFFALYNTLNGISTFFGSLLGGYLVPTFQAYGFNEMTAIQLTYVISIAGRLVGGLLFTLIKEPYKYDSTIRKELTKILSEDAEKVRISIETLEEKGEDIEKDIKEDLEWFDSLRYRKNED